MYATYGDLKWPKGFFFLKKGSKNTDVLPI